MGTLKLVLTIVQVLAALFLVIAILDSRKAKKQAT